MTMIMDPRMIVRIYRRDLVAADACAGGLAVYDAIAAIATDAGDKRASKRLRLRWTPLHALWLASVHPDYARWLVDTRIVPSLAYARLDRASLVGARLDGARLDGASLDGARLDRASLVGASLDGASLAYARLDRASLVGASLDGARLVGARLDGARLDGARLVGASLDRASLVGASLDGACLDGARLDGACLDGASLDGASLDGASLDGCYWPKSRPAPAGWTHDPPLADREWVVLRRAPAGGEVPRGL